MRYEFRSVVAADDSFRRHRGRQPLCHGNTVAVVDYIQYAELASALDCVGDKVHGPSCVVVLWCDQRVLHPGRKPPAERNAIVERHILVNAVHALVVPFVAVVSWAVEDLPETDGAMAALALMASSTS